LGSTTDQSVRSRNTKSGESSMPCSSSARWNRHPAECGPRCRSRGRRYPSAPRLRSPTRRPPAPQWTPGVPWLRSQSPRCLPLGSIGSGDARPGLRQSLARRGRPWPPTRPQPQPSRRSSAVRNSPIPPFQLSGTQSIKTILPASGRPGFAPLGCSRVWNRKSSRYDSLHSSKTKPIASTDKTLNQPLLMAQLPSRNGNCTTLIGAAMG
jgi:hypothetical protein